MAGTLGVGAEILSKFEGGLDPENPESSRIPVGVPGYGETSIVFEIAVEGLEGLIFKRIPIFP